MPSIVKLLMQEQSLVKLNQEQRLEASVSKLWDYVAMASYLEIPEVSSSTLPALHSHTPSVC